MSLLNLSDDEIYYLTTIADVKSIGRLSQTHSRLRNLCLTPRFRQIIEKKIVEELHKRYESKEFALIEMSRIGALYRVDLLLQSGTNPSDYALTEASRSGHIAVVNRLLEDPRFDPDWSRGAGAIEAACWTGHLAIVNRLLEDPRLHPDSSILAAAASGHLDIVKRLLDWRAFGPRSALIQQILLHDIKQALKLAQNLARQEVAKFLSQYLNMS